MSVWPSSSPLVRPSDQRGLTLVELLVVLVLLIATALLVVPLFSDLSFGSGNNRKSLQQIATEQTLMQVRAAILGTEGQKGLWSDLGQRDAYLPQKMADLFNPSSTLPLSLQSYYDPNTRLGWRGPYLLSSGARYGVNDVYGAENDPAVLDGWGNPILIQTPDAQYIRIVSKGADGVLDTPPADTMPALATCGDDVVLFLRVADTRS